MKISKHFLLLCSVSTAVSAAMIYKPAACWPGYTQRSIAFSDAPFGKPKITTPKAQKQLLAVRPAMMCDRRIRLLEKVMGYVPKKICTLFQVMLRGFRLTTQ